MPNKLARKVRIAPRVIANQYAEGRVDLLLQRNFFVKILNQLVDKDSRNVLAAMNAVRELPGRLRTLKKSAEQVAKNWTLLSRGTTQPTAFYKDALARGIKSLQKSKSPEKQERLQAYQELYSGDLNPDLKKLSDEVETLAKQIQNKASNRKSGGNTSVGSVFFNAVDTNGDGHLSEEEIGNFLDALEDEVGARFVDTLFSELSDDEDDWDDDDDDELGDDDDDDDDWEDDFDDEEVDLDL